MPLREALYRAFLDRDAFVAWLPPGSMRGVVHAFDGREGGSFTMSLVYPESEGSSQGKTSRSTDTFRIVWSIEFESADPSFAGEMTVSTTLAPEGRGTKVTIICENIPRGTRPEDNEAGCRSSLEKLASFVGG